MNERKKGKKNIKRILMMLTVLVLIISIIFIFLKLINSNREEANNNVNTADSKNGDDGKKEEGVEQSEIEQAFLERNGEKLESLPILMYHFFYDESAGETGQDSNWMEIASFEEQMKYLSENNYYYPSWDEVYDFVNGTLDLPSRSVVVTIDDGDMSFFRLAVPILEKYDVKATSFIVTSWTGEDMINQYKSNKLDFQSHSHDMHRPGTDGKGVFLTMTHNEATSDLEISKSILGSSNAFCYPFGHVSEFTSQILTEVGYKVAVTTNSGRVTSGQDPLRLTRMRMSKGDTLAEFINRVK